MHTEQYDIFELSLNGPSKGNPFKDVSLRCSFSQGETSLTPEGFYDGDGVYKVRFMPETTGVWTYETTSNVAVLDGVTGSFTCTPASEGNHGPVRVANTHHFAYADDTPHFSFGTTCYAWVHQTPELIAQTLETLKGGYFNKMRMCLFPKHYRYSQNEPDLYPFERDAELNIDLTRFSPAFFTHFEKQVAALRDLGIQADIIIFHPYDSWGHSEMDAETDDFYLHYLVARLAAYRNVWWSMANEFDFMKAKVMDDWDRFLKTVRDCDPYGHLRGNHNGAVRYDHSKPWVTHVSVQTSDMQSGRAQREQFQKPVVFDEVCYEGNIPDMWGNITAQELVHRFWTGVTVGCYVGHGETYMHPADILWWSKGGVLHGQSPVRIKFLKEIVEAGPATGLDPIGKFWYDSSRLVGKEGEYYLIYFGVHAPGMYDTLHLPEDAQFQVDIIDTWEMTITPVGVFSGKTSVELPGKAYMAIRAVRIED